MRTTTQRRQRLEEIAYLYFEGKKAREIAEDTDISLRTVQRDIKYIKEHRNEFLS